MKSIEQHRMEPFGVTSNSPENEMKHNVSSLLSISILCVLLANFSVTLGAPIEKFDQIRQYSAIFFSVCLIINSTYSAYKIQWTQWMALVLNTGSIILIVRSISLGLLFDFWWFQYFIIGQILLLLISGFASLHEKRKLGEEFKNT
jgi:hypothetical protein